MIILITGVTGTVGEAFVRLLGADNIIYGIDHNEERLAALRLEHPNARLFLGEFDEFNFSIANIDLVIHLAAFKHIDLCETNVNACVVNNVIRTHNLFKVAKSTGADILFMSTDKAVEPNSMYGFSKALGEGMAREYGGAFARSGNVVASNGSVFTIWDNAIRNQQPLKITHKDMKRMFISPDALVEQTWQLYREGQKEIIPKMDEDTKLVDLAARKLAEHGYTLDNYPGGVEFIGLRPGEKLEERLTWER